MACKANIPLDLLRRSSRLTSKTTEYHCDAPISHERKRLKSTVKTELHDEKVGIKLVDDDEKLSKESHIKAPPQPDGYIEIDTSELDLERTLLGGQSFRWTKDELEEPTSFTGVIRNHVFQLWRPNSDRIAFRVLNKTPANSPKLTRSILEDYFHLSYRLKDLYPDWSKRDPHLSECCKQYQGFRILRQDPVENVFSFICATNNNIKRISQMVDKLCQRFGDTLENSDEEKCSIYDSFQTFPSVERLAEDDVFDCLRYELGFGYRAKFIHSTAKQILGLTKGSDCSTPRDYLMSLRKLAYKDTCKQLMQFPGIGRKVADCICLMSMDHLNSVPIDCHIYEIVCRHYMPNLRQERKTLTEAVHDMIGKYFNDLHGPLAGWSTSVLFIAELKHLKLKDQPAKSEKQSCKPKKTKVNNK